jgi:protoporphyrinogen oxidase
MTNPTATMNKKMKIGIVGGGLMGLALAQRLAKAKHQVTVFEREQQVGGLATYHDYGQFFWDRFYHVILPTDRQLINFIGDLGLADRLRWQRTRTGFFVDDHLYSLSSGLDFLRFSPLTFVSKCRFVFTILWGSRLKNWQRLEKISVADWLRKISGKATFEKIWKPLLLAKLGTEFERVSAVFIWSYITRMFSARDRSTQKEHLGYVAGGYKTVFDRLESAIKENGGNIRLGVSVSQIEPRQGGGLSLVQNDTKEYFEKIIFTSPVDVLQRVASKQLVNLARRGEQVEYLGVVCMVLVTKQPLVPHYIVNIADSRVPFTGIIGLSNLVAPNETGGLHVTYLPKYIHSDSPMLAQSDDDIRRSFFAGLTTMFGDWEKCGVESVHINRARRVQPLQVLNYSSIVPQVSTAHPDFFVLNTSQFTHMTLNNNEVIRAVDEFLEANAASFAPMEATRRELAATHAPEPIQAH